MAKKRRTFSREYKQEALRLAEGEGVTIARAARDLGICENSLRRWKAELGASPGAFPGKGRSSPETEEMDRLRRQVRQLEVERDFLR